VSITTRILGIDPGSRLLGVGIIELTGKKAALVMHETLVLHDLPLPERLGTIFSKLSNIIQEHHPEEMAIEQVFVQKNAQSALKLGQARGVAIACGAVHHLSVMEYAPRQIKLAVVGKGGAEKAQVQYMVKVLLGITKKLPPDSADALAIALCHSYHRMNDYASLLVRNAG
jgi:crossover junction endodeoxyribonuclease RuvC